MYGKKRQSNKKIAYSKTVPVMIKIYSRQLNVGLKMFFHNMVSNKNVKTIL